MTKRNRSSVFITLYIEETLNANISDRSNQLKHILVHNCFYILGETKTCIMYQSIPSLTIPPGNFFMGEFLTPWAYKNELKPHPPGHFSQLFTVKT